MPEEPRVKQQASAQDPGEAAAILRKRAQELSRYRHEEKAQPPGRMVLEFVVKGDRYALPVSYMREVHPLRKMATLPGTPDFVRGVVLIRGQLVSVLDLRVLLGLPPSSVRKDSFALVLEDRVMTFAILADEIGEIRLLADEELRAGEPSLQRMDPRYVAGITRDRILLLDAEKMLADPALVVNG